MKRLALFGLLLGVASVAVAIGSLQSARGAAPKIPAHIGGVVPTIGNQVQGSGDLAYHGGPVMTTNKTYAIYWKPAGSSMAPGYDTTINQYFADVAHDSNMSTNVYAATTQYYQNPGQVHIQYSSSFATSVTDTNPFPANGCPAYDGLTVCLTDAQIQAEIDSVINSHGWQRNGTNMFFMFTAQNIGSCFDSSGSTCAFTAYCAYHGTSSSGAIYANMPYTGGVGGCDQGQYPNGASNQADPTINVTSHEHNEAITDPQLNAWYDAAGYEDGDKCAWDFGALQGPGGAQYNQTINGHHYFLQREYSNNGHLCVQTYTIGGGGGGGVPKVSFFFPMGGSVGTSVSISGQHFTGTTSVTLDGKAESFHVNSDTSITAKIVFGTPKGSWPFKVTNPSGTGTSTASFLVH
jgi:hypothetical protein